MKLENAAQDTATETLAGVPTRKKVYMKLIQSGNMLEFFTYLKPIIVNETRKRGANEATEEEREEWRKRNKHKSFLNMQRLVRLTFDKEGTSRFLTLTFEENITDVTGANYLFKVHPALPLQIWFRI